MIGVVSGLMVATFRMALTGHLIRNCKRNDSILISGKGRFQAKLKYRHFLRRNSVGWSWNRVTQPFSMYTTWSAKEWNQNFQTAVTQVEEKCVKVSRLGFQMDFGSNPFVGRLGRLEGVGFLFVKASSSLVKGQDCCLVQSLVGRKLL